MVKILICEIKRCWKLDFKLSSGPGWLLFPASCLHANQTLRVQNQDQQSGSSKWNAAIVNVMNSTCAVKISVPSS